MTPEDTSKIVAAIDRLRVSIYNQLDWIFAAILLAGMMSGCPRMIATPLQPPLTYEIGTPPLPPPNPHVQYSHTQYVPGPDGVLPLEVFAPRLVAANSPIGHPGPLGPTGPVEVPEPAMFALMLTGLMAMSIYLIVDSFLEGRRLKRLETRISACEIRAEVYQCALEHIASCSRDEDSRAVAKKALEESK